MGVSCKGQSPVVGCYRHINTFLGSIQVRVYLDCLEDRGLLDEAHLNSQTV